MRVTVRAQRARPHPPRPPLLPPSSARVTVTRSSPPEGAEGSPRCEARGPADVKNTAPNRPASVRERKQSPWRSSVCGAGGGKHDEQGVVRGGRAQNQPGHSRRLWPPRWSSWDLQGGWPSAVLLTGLGEEEQRSREGFPLTRREGTAEVEPTVATRPGG